MALREKLIIGATSLALIVGTAGLGGCSHANKGGIENIVEKPTIEQSIPSCSEELAQVYKRIDDCNIPHDKKEKYKEVYRNIDMDNLSEFEKSMLEDIKNVNYGWYTLQLELSNDKLYKQFPWLEIKFNNDEFCLDTKNSKYIDIVFLSRMATEEFYKNYEKGLDEGFKMDEQRVKKGGYFQLSRDGWISIKTHNKYGIKEAYIKDKDGNILYDFLDSSDHPNDPKRKHTITRKYTSCTITDTEGKKTEIPVPSNPHFLNEMLFPSDTEGMYQFDPTKKYALVIIDTKGKKREIRSTPPDPSTPSGYSIKLLEEMKTWDNKTENNKKNYPAFLNFQISRKGWVAFKAYDEDGIKKAFIKDQTGDVVYSFDWGIPIPTRIKSITGIPPSENIEEHVTPATIPPENLEERFSPSEIKIDPTKKYTLVIIDCKGEKREIQSTSPDYDKK